MRTSSREATTGAAAPPGEGNAAERGATAGLEKMSDIRVVLVLRDILLNLEI